MKIKTSISIDEKLKAWIDKQIASKRFASTSHAIEFIVSSFIRNEGESALSNRSTEVETDS